MATETVTLQTLHDDLTGLRADVQQVKALLEEDLELADDVVKEIEESRRRPPEEFVSHEEMKREFGIE